MKKFNTEYIQKYLIQGNFESNFISTIINPNDNKKRVFNEGYNINHINYF